MMNEKPNTNGPQAQRKAEEPQAEKRNPNALQVGYLQESLRKPVRARLLDGKILVGVLVGFDQFTLQLLTPVEGDEPILLYKQSIAYLQRAKPGKGGGNDKPEP
jgi:small nuclear ribonucleoprotein (snRNP)-like protein